MAVDYTDALEAGWRIFPLYPIVDGSCSCGDAECTNAGKHPKNGNWQHTAELDDAQLAFLEDFDDMFFGNQLLNHYGIVVNTSGLLVVDVDGRNGGFESAEKIKHIREQAAYIVRTGGGGEHWYYTNSADVSLMTNVQNLKGIDFKSTGFVVGCGSIHGSGMRYEALKGSPVKITEAPEELIDLLKRPERKTFSIEGSVVGESELARIVDHIPNTERDYEKWIRVGMAIHHATNGDAYELWVSWSRKNEAHDEKDMDYKWHSFGKSGDPVTQGTLLTWAREGGYSEPVTFIDDTDWGDTKEDEKTPPSRKISDYAALIPDGSIVKEVFQWIDGNCLFPRREIAFAAAVQSVSNIVSLNHRIAKHNTTLNLITFAIADSATGKEAVYQSILELMRVAAIGRSVHGAIKSEQEIIRNLIRNQASHYVVDEYGTELSKIAHAKKGSGANYLIAIPETIMSIYTKANEYYMVTGDMAEEQRVRLERMLALRQKQEDEGRDVKEHIERIKKQIEATEVGIPEPLLTFFGISEPTSFDAAITNNIGLITNGFIGRALIFREHIGVPDIRPDFIGKRPVPELLKSRLFNLYSQGHTVNIGDSVERKGDVIYIEITDEAENELQKIYQFYRHEALALEQEGQGIHTVALRGREMVMKLAAIFSIPSCAISEPVIDTKHIIAAQKIIAELMQYKINHCKTVIGANSNDSTEKGSAILGGIIDVIRAHGDDGVTAGIIRNRLRSFTRDQVDAGIAHLVEQDGRVKMVEYRDGRNRIQKKYLLK